MHWKWARISDVPWLEILKQKYGSFNYKCHSRHLLLPSYTFFVQIVTLYTDLTAARLSMTCNTFGRKIYPPPPPSPSFLFRPNAEHRCLRITHKSAELATLIVPDSMSMFALPGTKTMADFLNKTNFTFIGQTTHIGPSCKHTS